MILNLLGCVAKNDISEMKQIKSDSNRCVQIDAVLLPLRGLSRRSGDHWTGVRQTAEKHFTC